MTSQAVLRPWLEARNRPSNKFSFQVFKLSQRGPRLPRSVRLLPRGLPLDRLPLPERQRHRVSAAAARVRELAAHAVVVAAHEGLLLSSHLGHQVVLPFLSRLW